MREKLTISSPQALIAKAILKQMFGDSYSDDTLLKAVDKVNKKELKHTGVPDKRVA